MEGGPIVLSSKALIGFDNQKQLDHNSIKSIYFKEHTISNQDDSVTIKPRPEGGYTVAVDNEPVGIVTQQQSGTWAARASEQEDEHVSTGHETAEDGIQALVDFYRETNPAL